MGLNGGSSRFSGLVRADGFGGNGVFPRIMRVVAPDSIKQTARTLAAARTLAVRAMVVVVAGLAMAAQAAERTGALPVAELELQVEPEQPTLISEVLLEARIVVGFGQQVEFQLESVDPAAWSLTSPANPAAATRWRGDRVEHVASWALTPLIPGRVELPQVRARVSAAPDDAPDGGLAEGFDRMTGGGWVTIAPPPAASGELMPGPGDVVTEWPAAGQSWPAWRVALAVVVTLLLVAAPVWWLARRRPLAADDSPEARLARLRDQLERLRLSDELPTRSQLVRWRTLLVRGRRSLPDGLLAQVDGLLYQSGTFDGLTARTWAADVAHWLDQSPPAEGDEGARPTDPVESD